MAGQPVQLEQQIVAVRSDKGQPALEFPSAKCGQRRCEALGELFDGHPVVGPFAAGIRICVDARVAGEDAELRCEPRTVIGAGDGEVRGSDTGSQRVDQGESCGDDLDAQGDETLVPDLERREAAAAHALRARRLEQGVPLSEGAVVVREHAREPWRAQHEKSVEEASSPTGIPADERQILRREQHAGEVARQLSGLGGRSRDLRPVRA